MPDEPEIETRDLQEHIEEAHHHGSSEGPGWIRFVALSTAAFAAFAAVGALQAGSLVNQAMMDQIRAADAWNEYQADKQKAHSYEVEANRLVDEGATLPAERSAAVATKTAKTPKDGVRLRRESPTARLAEYEEESARELEKSAKLGEEAKGREEKAAMQLEKHERFAYSVALLQVAIALGAVSAISKSKPVWFASGILGLIGIVFFALGFVR